MLFISLFSVCIYGQWAHSEFGCIFYIEFFFDIIGMNRKNEYEKGVRHFVVFFVVMRIRLIRGAGE